MTTNVRRLKRKWVIVGALLAVLGVVLYWVESSTSLPLDENLVSTESRAKRVAPKSGWFKRVLWEYNYSKKHPPSNPLAHRFSASESRSCHIGSLLNQCMDVSGTHYLIEKKVATGNVMFGHTNVLNGHQWVQAFEEALQKNSPQWYDMGDHEFHSDNLVLLRYDKGTVLVLTPATAQKYREKYPKLAPLER